MGATSQRRGGRGARERILAAATTLFAREGIHTGVARLVETAEVSTRTFYQHFPSKDALVTEYLRQLHVEKPLAPEAALERTDRTPRERLLDVFAVPDRIGVVRGCPFHNAAVEAAGALPDVRDLVRTHKDAFTGRLIDDLVPHGSPETVAAGLAGQFDAGADHVAIQVLPGPGEGPMPGLRALAGQLVDRLPPFPRA